MLIGLSRARVDATLQQPARRTLQQPAPPLSRARVDATSRGVLRISSVPPLPRAWMPQEETSTALQESPISPARAGHRESQSSP
jgi:hypothetical protein